jgi:organic hydroperoxide reductase OsmC/OhrA
MTTHNAVLDWSLGDQIADTDYLAGRYSRAHTIAFDGGLIIPASASTSVVRIPWSKEDAADPEEMLVASASSCHMLWFLDFAKHAGLVVRRYHDEPLGTMGAMADGSVGIVRVTLRPAVTFGGAAPTVAALDALHQKAHAACTIAHSLKGEVVVEPVAQGTAS